MSVAYETPALRRLAALRSPGGRFRITYREAGAGRGVEALKGEPITRGQIRRQRGPAQAAQEYRGQKRAA